MQSTPQHAESRYTSIRRAVLAEVNREFARSGKERLNAKLIDQLALNESKRWDLSACRRVDWDWLDGYRAFSFRYPKRFEMALWSSSELVSLSLGRPTFHGSKLRLDFIEANPEKPLGVNAFEATFIAMAGYASALGANELRVMNPINDEVRRYYERYGFTYVPRQDFLFVKL